MVACLQKPQHPWETTKKKIQNTLLSPSMCCLCAKDEETLDHLFLHCPFTRKAWYTLFGIFDLELCLPSKIDRWMIEGLNFRGYSPKGNILWKCATRSLLWSIWKERNSRIFDDRFNSFDSFWTVVQHTASWWSTNYTKHFCNYSLSMIFNNWKAIMS